MALPIRFRKTLKYKVFRKYFAQSAVNDSASPSIASASPATATTSPAPDAGEFGA